ncbi:MAG: 4Fe-4S binding protein [Synergistaceae bacterium]|jgi:NAD-dependent dihydropyrimidine dehydrogenase PreA subunit|nr:4Fe-4S binding protein [Synergistaceae bacterium]
MTLVYLKGVATLSLDAEKCVGCGKCAEVCPHGVFDVADQRARIVQKDLCMECGACALNCPSEAIEVNAGVGCAAAIINGWFTGKEPACDCSGGECC